MDQLFLKMSFCICTIHSYVQCGVVVLGVVLMTPKKFVTAMGLVHK